MYSYVAFLHFFSIVAHVLYFVTVATGTVYYWIADNIW